MFAFCASGVTVNADASEFADEEEGLAPTKAPKSSLGAVEAAGAGVVVTDGVEKSSKLPTAGEAAGAGAAGAVTRAG